MTIAILANRLYVPAAAVTDQHRRAYTYWFGPDEASDDPEAYREIRTYREVGPWVGFPRGDMPKLLAAFEGFDIQDDRQHAPHGYDLAFTGELTADQQAVWRAWSKRPRGLVECPARWGKTVWLAYVACQLGQRVLVLTQEVSLLEQFEEQFREFTNIDQLEQQAGHRLIGHIKKATDVFDIVTLARWQKYHYNLADLRALRDHWGAVFVDEVHRAGAKCYSRIINTLNARYRVGVTATPKRKDGLEVVVYDALGQVTARGTVEQLPVDVTIVRTGVVAPVHYGQPIEVQWNKLLAFLIRHKDRNQLIVDRVLADWRAGHKVVVITDRVRHLIQLAKMLEDQAPGIQVGRVHGEVVGKARKRLRLAAVAEELDVVVATSQIVQLGWNVWPWSSLHAALPMSNRYNWYQRISRVRTKCPTCPGVRDPECLGASCMKRRPACTIYADEARIVQGGLKVQSEEHARLGFAEREVRVNLGRTRPTGPASVGRIKRWDELTG